MSAMREGGILAVPECLAELVCPVEDLESFFIGANFAIEGGETPGESYQPVRDVFWGIQGVHQSESDGRDLRPIFAKLSRGKGCGRHVGSLLVRFDSTERERREIGTALGSASYIGHRWRDEKEQVDTLPGGGRWRYDVSTSAASDLKSAQGLCDWSVFSCIFLCRHLCIRRQLLCVRVTGNVPTLSRGRASVGRMSIEVKTRANVSEGRRVPRFEPQKA